MQEQMFQEKIQLILDPYFDREFFTNLIYLIDRKKTPREIFEASVRMLNTTPKWTPEMDQSLLHLFCAYQVSSLVRENYQWLSLANGLYTAALNRGNGEKLVALKEISSSTPQAVTPQEFESQIRRDVRAVESQNAAWGGLLFLLEKRTTRAQATSALIKHALVSSDAVTFELLVSSLEVAMASGWKANGDMLKRAFDRFWESDGAPEIAVQGVRLAQGMSFQFQVGGVSEWQASYAEDLWKRISEQSFESAWEMIRTLAEKGVSLDQISALLVLFRGRLLFTMKKEQWARVARSIVYAEALQTASTFAPEERLNCLAVNLCDLVKVTQLVGSAIPDRPTGASVLDGASKNISKDRLVLRLDDAIERGAREEALDLITVILKDEGLSSSVCDRLLLSAAKQDGWTYDSRTIPLAYSLTKAFNTCVRRGVKGSAVTDGLYGLLRFLCDQRELSLMIVPLTGTYGNGLPLSQFDVSGGARIVDRFLFNQMRNAQRVKVWPSDN